MPIGSLQGALFLGWLTVMMTSFVQSASLDMGMQLPKDTARPHRLPVGDQCSTPTCGPRLGGKDVRLVHTHVTCDKAHVHATWRPAWWPWAPPEGTDNPNMPHAEQLIIKQVAVIVLINGCQWLQHAKCENA